MARRDKKRPAAAFNPDPKKRPSAELDPDDYRGRKPLWSFRLIDAAGSAWSWDKLGEKSRAVFERLRELEALTWHEIELQQSKGNAMHGHIETDRVAPEAQQRLAALGLQDNDTLFKFRIDKTGRVWGIRVAAVCRLLWWDSNHTVYPMNVTDN